MTRHDVQVPSGTAEFPEQATWGMKLGTNTPHHTTAYLRHTL